MTEVEKSLSPSTSRWSSEESVDISQYHPLPTKLRGNDVDNDDAVSTYSFTSECWSFPGAHGYIDIKRDDVSFSTISLLDFLQEEDNISISSSLTNVTDIATSIFESDDEDIVLTESREEIIFVSTATKFLDDVILEVVERMNN